MKLGKLLKSFRSSDIQIDGEFSDLQIFGLSYDSRTVSPGDLFFCLKGEHGDGHNFVLEAIANGACALVVERKVNAEILQIVVSNPRSTMGDIAEIFYGFPSREITSVGVTGTNGKTTTISMLSEIAKAAGESPATIGTLTGQLTTPEAPEVQRQIRSFVQEGASFLAMEVSSHALNQNRISMMSYDATIFTNLTLDHLDYHGDMENYYRAKSKLFTADHSKLAVVNADNSFGQRLLNEISIPKLSFSLADIEVINQTLSKTTFKWGRQLIELNLPGKFNLENALGAAVASEALGIDREDIAQGLGNMSGVPGRFQMIQHSENQPYVIIDYSHTPDGLERSLLMIKELSHEGEVHVVFGCGGDRDDSKRPEMGRISERLASNVYLTSDNPRSENQIAIINDILSGIKDVNRVYVNPDRRVAIHHAVKSADKNDIVLIAGKGCEPYQEINGTLSSFLDIDVGREALEARQK
ncbi:MAG: UDP-N-acetylmuramoyl-L-alanyl-D-glutamate--2,6-diaminopimelate ligase [Acidimicrobiaceae bacterium]|nr:UDP-N-acetylmuramoyl-L-alanyl-D-glutamate--2,6-diaminopimelate ligase [Acidimicrobiaceae bacterium]|tara:strand:- start:15195 stop:16604 length:1410 start_codon:yes stop_codon:yes gene_type:complete